MCTMDLVTSVVKDVAVLRRMLFATTSLPRGMPQYWEVTACFSNQGSNASQVRLLMENLQTLHTQAFSSDLVLTNELLSSDSNPSIQPLGVVLVSAKDTCCSCSAETVQVELHYT